MSSDNVTSLEAARRRRRGGRRPSPSTEGAQLYTLPLTPPRPASPAEPEPEPEEPAAAAAPPPLEDDDRPWTRAELEADRARNAWNATTPDYGPEAITRSQLEADRRTHGQSWRLRAGLFALNEPADD